MTRDNINEQQDTTSEQTHATLGEVLKQQEDIMGLEGENCSPEDHTLEFAIEYKLTGSHPPTLKKTRNEL